MLLSLSLKIVLFDILFGWIFEIFLGAIFQFFYKIGHFFLIGDDGDHFLFHPTIGVLKLIANVYIFGVFLDESEHSLKDDIKDGIMLQSLCVLAVI